MSDGSRLVLKVQSKATILSDVNLLIVTDDAADLGNIFSILKSADINFAYDTVAASDPIWDLLDRSYDAIIYSYHVSHNYQAVKSPGQKLKWWYALPKKVPLILITDILGDEIAVELIQSGISGYVLRHQLSKLPDILESAIANFARQQQSLTQRDLIQKQQKYIKQLEAEKQSREAAEIARQEHISHLTHELRSPISSILGFAKMLKEQYYGSLNERQLKYASALVTTGQHLLDLVNNYLDLAKIEAHKQELNLERLAVEDVCQASLSMVEQKAKDKELKLIFELADDVDFCVADPVRLKQILVNLIYNAVKFTDRGSVTLQVKTDNNWLLFSVIDTGIGISPENIKKLFQPFQQIKGHHEGTGLGLVLSRKLAQLHGGDITVDSKLDRGSCFTVYIPRDRLSNID